VPAEYLIDPEGRRRWVHLVRNGPRHAAAVPQLLVSGVHDGTDFLFAQVAVSGLKQHRASHVAGAHLEGAPRHSDEKEEGRRMDGRGSRRKHVERRRSGTSAIILDLQFSIHTKGAECHGP
jgi:hypothetical protein